MKLIYFIVFLISYLIGSIPFSYIFAKKYKNIDLTKEGSHNLGAMNAYESTHNIWIGVMVLLGDIAKGALTTAIAINFEQSIEVTYFSTIGAVLGHNYSTFMKLKGGRGLAVSAGALLLINPLAVITWILLYFISRYAISRNVHIDNLIALVITPIALIYLPDYLLWDLTIYSFFDIRKYRILVAIVSFLIIIKHIEPIYSLIKNRKNEVLMNSDKIEKK